MMPDPSLDPVLNDLSRPFHAGTLALPFCIATERHFWPLSPSSPFVTAGQTEWRMASPVGRLMSLVIYHRVFHPVFGDAVPYGIGLVELDVGPCLRVHVVDVTSRRRLVVGDDVQVGFAAVAEGLSPVPVAQHPDG